MSWLNRHNVFLAQNYFLYAIAFLIPLYPKAVPPLILLFGICSVLAILKKYSRVEMGEVAILMLLFYGLHLIGMLYTENLERGWFDLEVKLSLVAFPLAFVGFRFLRATNYKRTLRMFVYGTVSASLMCLIQSAYKYYVLDLPYYHFLTSRFSFIIHPSYFALYNIFSILILTRLEWPFAGKKPLRITMIGFMFLFLSVSVLLTGSKTGFLMWIIISLSITVVFIKIAKHKWLPVVGLALIMSVIGVIFQNAPLLRSKVINVLNVAQSNELDPKATESTAARALVYDSAIEIIKHQNWYGQGTGDFQDALDRAYNEKGYEFAALRHLNAHNLFLQTWVALGIPGTVMLAGLFITLLILAIKHREPLMLGFTLIFIIISLTESTFYVQAGVVFFAFFAVLTSRRASMEVGLQKAE